MNYLNIYFCFYVRWRFLLSLSLVNGLYIVTGFLLNFKEISRMFYKCCAFDEPFLSKNMHLYRDLYDLNVVTTVCTIFKSRVRRRANMRSHYILIYEGFLHES